MGRNSHDPWLRSVDEGGPRRGRVSIPEMVIAVVVVGLIVAMAVWFLFIAKGGLGLGSV